MTDTERHPNFYLWNIIQGMVNASEIPHEDRVCGWCEKEAVILLPRDHWDDASPLTHPACTYHGGLDALMEAVDGTHPYVTEYLNHFEEGI